ncbi:MAG: DUF790 family protein [Planctomycetaceae bacterium]
MLTRDLAIATYDRSRVLPDRLTRGAHGHYVQFAERMLQVYRTGAGRTRSELHRDVHNLFAFELNCPTRRIDAFCKLLDEVSEFDSDSRGRAAELRRQVFHSAAKLHPLVKQADRLFETTEAQAKSQIAEQLGRPWDVVEAELFADIIDFHRLKAFDGEGSTGGSPVIALEPDNAEAPDAREPRAPRYPDAVSLLSRYNVAQVQVALFGALSLTVWATEDFKTILRYAKLARLMHTIRRVSDTEYEFTFDGPASVLHETRRYGVGMAKFLPALLACRGWRMHAVIQTSRAGWQVALDLSPADGLRSHLPEPDEFDSDIESEFARKWGGEPRDGWTLLRESDILHIGQKVFLPDFTFQHIDGRKVLLEIIGFWTSEYLVKKLQTIHEFRSTPLLLAIQEHLAEQLTGLPVGTIVYKTALKVKDVLERLTAVNVAVIAPRDEPSTLDSLDSETCCR